MNSTDNNKSIFEKLGLIKRIDDTNEISNTVEVEKIEELEEIEPVIEHDKQTETNNLGDDNIMDNFIDIQAIYKQNNKDNEHISTIFILDSFSKALPDNLPDDIKRQSVLSIASASNMNINNLLQDGVERLQILDKFANDFSNKTSEVISENEKEIQKLMEKIQQHKKIIEKRNKLQEKQKLAIQYEKEKIDNILNFIGKTND